MMNEKIFTLEEAEALLPRLEELLEHILEQRKSAMLIGQDLSRLQEDARSSGGKGIDPSALVNKQTELEFLVQIINEGLDAIEKMGAQPKDLDMGLIDFPAVIDGETVLLCWRMGEKTIDYYHDFTEGYSGRKPLKRR